LEPLGRNTGKDLRAALRSAEAELEAATKLSEVRTAAKEAMLAKEALKRLQGRPAKTTTPPRAIP
jgi:hypothetical protein